MSGELSGRVALVTGGSRNIGRAIALDLASAGASVVVAGHSDVAAAAAVVAEIESAGGRAIPVLADVRVEDDVARLFATAENAFGRLDILVNNAAVRREAEIEQISYAEWRDIMGIALDGPFLCCRAAIPLLSKSDAGTIINIGGMTAYSGASHRAHIVSAKAGLDGLTKALAHDLAPRNITVNLVSPGMMNTARSGPKPVHHATHATLLGRRGEPDELAAAVRFLAGPGARFITGQTLHVNGGAFLP